MKVFVSEKDRASYVSVLDGYLKERISEAVSFALAKQDYGSNDYINGVNNAMASRVCDLEDTIDIVYLPEKLRFFTFNNLRHQQDGMNAEVKRFDSLDEALQEYNSLPKEYTTALGITLKEFSELDFVHRVNGESVLVNDYKRNGNYIGNGLVLQVAQALVEKLGIEYEFDSLLFNSHFSKVPVSESFARKFDFHYLDAAVLTPLQHSADLNSYFKDKYLRAEKGSGSLLSAINQVYVEGEGWVNGKDFLTRLNDLYMYRDSMRYKVNTLNVNYVDLNGYEGQADIYPRDFKLLRQRTIERSAKHQALDGQIKDAAAKIDKPKQDVQKDIEREER